MVEKAGIQFKPLLEDFRLPYWNKKSERDSTYVLKKLQELAGKFPGYNHLEPSTWPQVTSVNLTEQNGGVIPRCLAYDPEYFRARVRTTGYEEGSEMARGSWLRYPANLTECGYLKAVAAMSADEIQKWKNAYNARFPMDDENEASKNVANSQAKTPTKYVKQTGTAKRSAENAMQDTNGEDAEMAAALQPFKKHCQSIATQLETIRKELSANADAAKKAAGLKDRTTTLEADIKQKNVTLESKIKRFERSKAALKAEISAKETELDSVKSELIITEAGLKRGEEYEKNLKKTETMLEGKLKSAKAMVDAAIP